MENLNIPIVIAVGFGLFVLLIAFLIIVNRIAVNVGAREIAIKERRYMGRRMPPGRVVATEGEVGIQADVLKPASDQVSVRESRTQSSPDRDRRR
jgi:hypothetical protein